MNDLVICPRYNFDISNAVHALEVQVAELRHKNAKLEQWCKQQESEIKYWKKEHTKALERVYEEQQK